MTTGAKLLKARTDAGLTIPELSVRAGVSVRTISMIETGSQTNPCVQTLRKLADALKIKLTELL